MWKNFNYYSSGLFPIYTYTAMGIGGAFSNAAVNAVLCWFYDSKKNAIVKVFTYAVFLFRFYSVVDNSWDLI